jgi:hypothetical protein
MGRARGFRPRTVFPAVKVRDDTRDYQLPSLVATRSAQLLGHNVMWPEALREPPPTAGKFASHQSPRDSYDAYLGNVAGSGAGAPAGGSGTLEAMAPQLVSADPGASAQERARRPFPRPRDRGANLLRRWLWAAAGGRHPCGADPSAATVTRAFRYSPSPIGKAFLGSGYPTAPFSPAELRGPGCTHHERPTDAGPAQRFPLGRLRRSCVALREACRTT